jgi:uncharacterized metal-binding protein
VSPAAHLVLTDIGIKKRFHMDFDADETADAYRKAVAAFKSIETDSHARKPSALLEAMHAQTSDDCVGR